MWNGKLKYRATSFPKSRLWKIYLRISDKIIWQPCVDNSYIRRHLRAHRWVGTSISAHHKHVIRLHTALADVCCYSLSTDDGRVQFCRSRWYPSGRRVPKHRTFLSIDRRLRGSIAWPPRSPDLTPLDFCVGTFKEFSVWNVNCVRGTRCSDSCCCRSITT